MASIIENAKTIKGVFEGIRDVILEHDGDIPDGTPVTMYPQILDTWAGASNYIKLFPLYGSIEERYILCEFKRLLIIN